MKGADEGVNREAVNAMKTAIGLGYRHVDGAQSKSDAFKVHYCTVILTKDIVYNTEAEIGEAIRESGVARSEIFLTTKTTDLNNVEAALEKSLAALKTSYVDLSVSRSVNPKTQGLRGLAYVGLRYLIHSPFGARSKEHLQAVWRDMESCHKRGLARNIGVASFTISHIKSVLDTAVVRPAVCQIEMHPYLQQPKLLKYLHSEKIAVESVAALTSLTKVTGGPVDGACQQLATKHGVSESAILLRWAMDQDTVVVTTSGKQERLRAYITETSRFVLTPEEIQVISQAAGDKHFRGFFTTEFEAMDEELADNTVP
jgi:diketogulonate reductase-like aldo/keto reductase